MKTKNIKLKLIFSFENYSALLCSSKDLLLQALQLRYKAYRKDKLITKNEDEFFDDHFDYQSNTRVLGVWKNGACVGTIRNSVYHKNYDWEPISLCLNHPELFHLLGTKEPILESSRFAISPDLDRKSAFIVMGMLFRLQVIGSIINQVNHCVTAVRQNHLNFYIKYFGFEKLLEYNQIQNDQCFPSIVLAARTPISCTFPWSTSAKLYFDMDMVIENYSMLVNFQKNEIHKRNLSL